MALEKQPFFKAPSIPKLGKNIVSSSIFSSASKLKPQLKTTPFSFLKPIQSQKEQGQDVTQSLTKIISGENGKDKQIYSTLVETNRILVEIQKQLSLDFASRITEKKQSISGLRSSILKKRAVQKEKAIESVNNDSGLIRGAFDKITAPAKSIFDRIIQFLTTIATGFLVNAAFSWLSDEKNRKKLFTVFKFLTDHWKWIVGIFIGAKLIGAILKIVNLVRRIRGLVELIRRVWGKPPTKPLGGGPGGGGGDPCNRVLQCMGNPAYSAKFVAASIAAFIANQQLTEHIKRVAGSVVPAPPTPIPAVQPTLQQQYQQSRPGVPASGYSSTNVQAAQAAAAKKNYPDVDWGAVFDWALAGAAVLTPADAGIAGDAIAIANLLKNGRITVATLTRILGPKATENFLNYAKNKGIQIQQSPVARSKGGTIPKEAPKKKCDTCSLLPFFSVGGTVGGRGSGNVDSVPAMLAPGEEVIRTSSANLFRPLLKDINDNAGIMWSDFTDAIKKQEENNTYQRQVNFQFSDQLTELNKELENLIKQEKSKKIKDAGIKITPPVVGNIPPEEGTGRGGPSDINVPAPQLPGIPTKAPEPFTGSVPTDQNQGPQPTSPSTSILPPAPEPTPGNVPGSRMVDGVLPTQIEQQSQPIQPISETQPQSPILPAESVSPIPPKVKPFIPETTSVVPIKQPERTYALKPASKPNVSIAPFSLPPIVPGASGEMKQGTVSDASSPPDVYSTNRNNNYIVYAANAYGLVE